MPVVVHGLDDTADDELTWRRESLLTCTGHQPPHLALQVSLGMSHRDPQRVETGHICRVLEQVLREWWPGKAPGPLPPNFL